MKMIRTIVPAHRLIFPFRVATLAAALLLFNGCSEKVTVCGGKGVCCGVAYTSDDDGNLKNSWHQCVSDCSKCPPENLSGTPSCPVKNPPSDACGRSGKTVWIWEGDYWESTPMAAIATATSAAKAIVTDAPTAPIRLPDGKSVASMEPGFCKAACEITTGQRPTFCPSIVVPNDVSFGLLQLSVDLAEAEYAEPRVFKLDDVVRRFAVVGDIQGCSRGDVVWDKSKILNAGTQCNAGVSGGFAETHLEATLQTPPDLFAETGVAKGFAQFSDSTKAFSLELSEEIANRKFGGPIRVASRANKVEFSVAIDGSRGRVCAALTPRIVKEKRFVEMAAVLNSAPSIVRAARADFDALEISVGAALELNQKVHASDDPAFEMFPMSRTLSTILVSGKLPNARSYAAKIYRGSGEYARKGLGIVGVATVIETGLCHIAMREKSSREVADLIPVVNARDVLSSDLGLLRDRIAGQLLLCRYGGELLSPTLLKEIEAFASR